VPRGGSQSGVDVREQEHRDHRRPRQIDIEKIGGQKLGPVSHARLDRALFRGRHEAGVQLDADRPGATPGRGDHGASVTGAQIHDVVARTDLGHLQHGVHEDLRCRYPR
jgi:hypothetical protein